MSRRWYLAGPMTGLPELNFPAFHAATAALRAAGFDVVSPAELCADIAGRWADCMRRDLTAMLECDGVALLPGWEASKGARLECHVASELSMSVKTVVELLAPSKPMGNYGCVNRAPYPESHVFARDCQFTLTAIGRTDPRCFGCRWRAKGGA